MILGILGGGQLGMLLAQAANKIGNKIISDEKRKADMIF